MRLFKIGQKGIRDINGLRVPHRERPYFLKKRCLHFCTGVLLSSLVLSPVAYGAPKHGISMYDPLKYGPDATHLDYVNPAAPQGGTEEVSSLGSFDTLNSYSPTGTAATGLELYYIGSHLPFDQLCETALDESYSKYGLLAQTIDMADDRSSVTFKLRKEARFQDNTPVTADDLIWTYKTLTTKGRPMFKLMYQGVGKLEKLGPLTVKFNIDKGASKELPFLLCDLPVLPKHWWKDVDFTKALLKRPIGAGPYKVEKFEQGRYITYKKDPNYWGKNLLMNKGRNNFDKIRFTYYKDQNVRLEAFKADKVDYRYETDANHWFRDYTGDKFKNGQLIKRAFPTLYSDTMWTFAFNLRKPMFQDIRVREALIDAYDFQFLNRTLWHGLFIQSKSYAGESPMEAKGLPQGKELEILNTVKDKLPPEIFTQSAYVPPVTDGSGNNRTQLLKARKLLQEAGWVMDKDRKLLKNKKTGQYFIFEFLTYKQDGDKELLAYARNLKRLGILMSIRRIDVSSYTDRARKFNFDMLRLRRGNSTNPGMEQWDYWGQVAAGQVGSKNVTGIKSEAIDEIIDYLTKVNNSADLVASVRALDRVLRFMKLGVPVETSPQSQRYRMGLKGNLGIPNSKVRTFYPDLRSWWRKPASKK